MRLLEDRLREIRRSRHRIGERGAAQIRAAQVRRGQVAPRKIGPFELQPRDPRVPPGGMFRSLELQLIPVALQTAEVEAAVGLAAQHQRLIRRRRDEGEKGGRSGLRRRGLLERRLEPGVTRPCRRLLVLVRHRHPAAFGTRASAQPASGALVRRPRPNVRPSRACLPCPIRKSGVPGSAGPSLGGRTGWPRDRPGSARSCPGHRGRG